MLLGSLAELCNALPDSPYIKQILDMTIEIIGLGHALPPGSLTQDDAASAAIRLRRTDDAINYERELQLLNVLYRRSGVQKRHSVLLRTGGDAAVDRQTFYEVACSRLDRGPSTAARMGRYETEAPVLAENACREVLTRTAVEAESIDHLVTVSCSGFNSPGFDLALYERLGLNPNASRTHVGFMGCHGALNGLRVASALARSQPGANVLVCAVELCSLHHQYTDDPQQIVANSLFADGAAAAIVRAQSPTDSVKTQGWQLRANGSYVIPGTADAMSWRIGDHGFTMTLSAQVPEIIKTQLKPWLEQWLAQQDLSVSQVRTWAIHPGGPRIVSATASALGLTPQTVQTSLDVLNEYGNMSSPTILFILQRLLDQGSPGPCVALAFGPGLVVEAALLM